MEQNFKNLLKKETVTINNVEKEAYVIDLPEEKIIIFDEETKTIYRSTSPNNILTNELLGIKVDERECAKYKDVLCYSDEAFINTEEDEGAKNRIL